MKLKKLLPLLTLAPAASFAAAPDFTSLVSGIDFSTTVTAILAIGAAAVGLILAFKGVQYVYRSIKST